MAHRRTKLSKNIDQQAYDKYKYKSTSALDKAFRMIALSRPNAECKTNRFFLLNLQKYRVKKERPFAQRFTSSLINVLPVNMTKLTLSIGIPHANRFFDDDKNTVCPHDTYIQSLIARVKRMSHRWQCKQSHRYTLPDLSCVAMNS